MLQGASPTDTKMRTARCHPGRGRLENLQQLGVIVLPMQLGTPKADALARQRPGYEGSLAFPDDPLTIVGECSNSSDLFKRI
jgi:hypothetical protein